MIENIGKTIKLIRTRQGLKQAQLAEKAGLSVSFLSLVEKGRRTPSLEALEGIAEALEVPVNILIFLASDLTQLEKIDQDLAERLSFVAWKLIGSKDERAPVQE